ncbi:sugar phosphate isomerase/epimerase family protein [Nakamurella lactea]|uniref:sugar phosphate isomerase/epimerase family protein n=1 Tax=Nakamurella lactea TaxID=459515 RepID=UPI00040303AD|nr:sugar phosphate isomerase/epimerase [Nakamurella lactea]
MSSPAAPTPGLSVQLYTVRAALAADLPGTLQRIADIGFRDVEPFGFVDQADAYLEGLAAAGLSAPSAHAALIGQDTAAAFAAAKRLGVQTLIDPMVDRALWTRREDVEQTARQLNEIAAAAAAHGLTVGYHNHWWETENRIDGATALEVLAGMLDDAVVLEVDTYWADVGGASAPELLRRLGDRVALIHVKDGPATQQNIDQTAVGSGTLDIPAILAAAPQARRVVELDDFAGDVFDAVRDSYAWMGANGGAA